LKAERTAETASRSSSLSDLYVRQLPGAIGLAYLLTGDRSLAEDIAQEAFVRLTGRFAHIRSPEGFDAYLRKTVVNLSLSNLRHRRVERSFAERALGQAPPLPPEMPDVTLQEELWEALRQLPHRQRTAVVLRYFEDLSERQSAEILRCSVPALRSLVARAMESLRQLIRGDQDG
jgi:RNA polymerase sigma-70 factor (sigma-E family)